MDNWTFLGWYYFLGGEQVGPVPGGEIARLLAGGHLRPWDEVLKGWRDANGGTRFFGSHARDCLAGTVAAAVPA
jgi:hypothetical protein